MNLENNLLVLLAAAISFLVSALMGKWMVPLLRRINFGQTIREVGPKWHKKKNGTPTMGGFLFIIGVFLAAAVCLPLYYGQPSQDPALRSQSLTKAVGGLLMALGFGLVGFIDDYIKVVKKRNLGLNVKQKLVLQFLVAGAYLLTLSLSVWEPPPMCRLPGSVDLEIWFWILSAIGIVGIVNAVNFTDGIDGLNASVTFFVAVTFMVMAGILQNGGMSIAAAAVAGGCLGFLVWNFNPAKCFMGGYRLAFPGRRCLCPWLRRQHAGADFPRGNCLSV